MKWEAAKCIFTLFFKCVQYKIGVVAVIKISNYFCKMRDLLQELNTLDQ